MCLYCSVLIHPLCNAKFLKAKLPKKVTSYRLSGEVVFLAQSARLFNTTSLPRHIMLLHNSMFIVYSRHVYCKLTVSHLFRPYIHPPSPEQRPSPAGGFSRGRCGCVPCRSGAGPAMPPCPGMPFAFPPPGAMPFQPAAAYAVHWPPGVPHEDMTAGLPNLKLSGKRQIQRRRVNLGKCYQDICPEVFIGFQKMFVLHLDVFYNVGHCLIVPSPLKQSRQYLISILFIM